MEQRIRVKFCFKLGKKAADIYKMLKKFAARKRYLDHEILNGLNAFGTGAKASKMIHTQVGRNCDGLIHHEFLPLNRTTNGQFYTEIFYQLRKRIRTVRPYFPQNVSWLLLHDNARPHNALPVRIFLAQHGITEMQYPPFSPDLVPADFFLYSKLKNSLKGTRFQDIEAIKKTVTSLSKSIPKEDFKTSSEICTAEHRRALWLMGITLNHIK